MLRLDQKLELKQQLTPQQVLQASILQLNVAVLEQRILTELEENPVLELTMEEDPPESEEKQEKEEEGEKKEDDTPELDDKQEETDFDWEELLSDPDEYEFRTPYEKIEDDFEIQQRARRTFDEKLIEQLQDYNYNEQEIKIAEELIGNIDDDGYLTIDINIIADRFNVDKIVVSNILKKIQKLDPPGMGARTLQECLLAQIEVYDDYSLAKDIISDYFEDFANHRYDKILKGLEITKEDLQYAMEEISLLNPRPGSSISETDKDFIIPDLIMERADDGWSISVNDTTLPTVRINRQYNRILKDYGHDAEVKKFVGKKLESGKWFIDAIEQRRQTMLNVMSAIVQRQDKFFIDSDNRELKPMVLKNIADDIQMDISTISRVTNGKYVQLPFGIHELKEFFSEGIDTRNGQRVSNTIVKARLKELLDAEDKKKPIGDEELTQILNDEGYKVARRTVSKYREIQKIPVARLRREI